MSARHDRLEAALRDSALRRTRGRHPLRTKRKLGERVVRGHRAVPGRMGDLKLTGPLVHQAPPARRLLPSASWPTISVGRGRRPVPVSSSRPILASGVPQLLDHYQAVTSLPRQPGGSLRGRQCRMDSPYLALLSEEDRREVVRMARRRRFARNEVVFHEGDPADTFHLIDRGHVGVRMTTPLGDVGLLRVLGPGDAFGEMALIDPAPRNATIVALDACETLALHQQAFEALRHLHPQVDRLLLGAMVGEVRRLSEQVLELMYVPVDKRLHRRLVELAELYGGGSVLSIPLTQEDLAHVTGTTRQTANRILRRAEEAGLLKVGRGRIELLDVEGLARRGR